MIYTKSKLYTSYLKMILTEEQKSVKLWRKTLQGILPISKICFSGKCTFFSQQQCSQAKLPLPEWHLPYVLLIICEKICFGQQYCETILILYSTHRTLATFLRWFQLMNIIFTHKSVNINKFGMHKTNSGWVFG